MRAGWKSRVLSPGGGLRLLGLLAVAFAAQAGSSLSGQSPASNEVVALPEALEIELARSALPAHLREAATVYVYDPAAGFRVAVEGTNGFHALVGRDDPAIRWASFPFEAYEKDFIIPVAFDAAGRDAQLEAYLDLGRWRAEGVSASDAQRRLREGFARGEYAVPPRTGIGYMLAPVFRSFQRTEVDATIRTFQAPHYMFYAPDVSAEDVGAGIDPRQPLMRPSMPDPHGMIVLIAGETERLRYRDEGVELLEKLCRIHEPWCVR